MQNAQNNSSNFTVENLIAKYRDYAIKHCKKLSYLADCVDKDGKDYIKECFAPKSPEGNAEEQLLSVIYKTVAGDNAKKDILDALSVFSSTFYLDALTHDEFAFLCENYTEVVTYLFEHRDKWVFPIDSFLYQIPEERERLVKEYAKPTVGSTVFIADTKYCDLALQFSNCTVTGFTGDNHIDSKAVWALGQIRMWALGIKSYIASGERDNDMYTYNLPEEGSVDLVICGALGIWGTNHINLSALYDLLKPNGRMIFFSTFFDHMARKCQSPTNVISAFCRRVADDQTIESVVAFEEKGRIIDSMTKNVMLVINKKGGNAVNIKDERRGFSIDIAPECIDGDILWPSYYFTERPETGLPLSSIVSFVDLEDKEDHLKRKDGNSMLTEKMKEVPMIAPSDLASEYKNANLCEAHLKRAGDPVFEKWAFEIREVEKPCVLLWGNGEKYRVGYMTDLPENGMATLRGIICLVPKDGVDVRYVAALLLCPEVRHQIMSICDEEVHAGRFSLIVDKIIVPNHDDKERLAFLADVSDDAIRMIKQEMADSIETKISVLKSDYINEVRMRKHDMKPHLQQIKSADNLMRHYIETTTDIEELKKHLLAQVNYADNALTVISEIVEHLSEEEKFGVAEFVNIDNFLENIELSHDDREGFTIDYDCNRKSFNKAGLIIPNKIEAWENAKKQGVKYEEFVRQQTKETFPLYAEIAPFDFQRMVTNIIENARRHAFTDPSRKDYYIGIDLSHDNKTGMYQIDFSNNGNPLPKGMTKERYGIRGEKVGATAGTGNGGYIIKSIVNHYGGDYDVFTKDGITTIRIYLPIANKV